MNKPRRAVLALCTIATIGLGARAWAGTGETSAEFLKILPSPRVAAMGHSGTALADDHLSALSLNSAGLARLRYPEATFVYNKWLEGVSLQNVSYAHPTKDSGSFAVSGTWLQVKSIQGFDNSGAATGDVKAQDMALKVAWAKRFGGVSADPTHGFFFGAGLKYVREQLENVNASTILADLGVLYSRRYGRSALAGGVSLDSLGQGLKYDTQRDAAPTVMRMGLAYTTPVLEDPLSIVWDVRKPLREALSYGIGFEYMVLRSVSWRAGWTSNEDLGSGMSVGIGLKFKVFSIDYSLAQVGRLGPTHRIALGARFGAPVDSIAPTSYKVEEGTQWHLDKGSRLITEGRYYEAALEFTEVLRLDPHNKSALNHLRQVRDLMERAR